MSEIIHLSKDVPGLLDAAFVRQYSADAIRRPDVLVIIPQDRLVHGQGPVLVFLLLLLVLRGLVEGLKPHIPQSNVTEKGMVKNPHSIVGEELTCKRHWQCWAASGFSQTFSALICQSL